MSRHPPNFYDDTAALERYLNFPPGTLRQIPIYARAAAIDAIVRVKDMEAASLFRPGLYYIVLADLIGSTSFNTKYGDAEGDIRTEWFHTAVIQALGDLKPENYFAFSKTIGDASLILFSSFKDVFRWSRSLDNGMTSMSEEYGTSLEDRGVDVADEDFDERFEAFRLRARRLVHLGEVSYQDEVDPLSQAVSSTFKIEKEFSLTYLGCTQPVADAIGPKLPELGARLVQNAPIEIPGLTAKTMSYYVVPQ
jgi:hypothetical protein